jgi:hypothetical protein
MSDYMGNLNKNLTIEEVWEKANKLLLIEKEKENKDILKKVEKNVITKFKEVKVNGNKI